MVLCEVAEKNGCNWHQAQKISTKVKAEPFVSLFVILYDENLSSFHLFQEKYGSYRQT